MHIDPPQPIEFVNFGIAGGAKYRLICKNHPENAFHTKNPYTRSIFLERDDCACPVSDLLVTFIPNDVHDVPYGNHFRPGFNPESIHP